MTSFPAGLPGGPAIQFGGFQGYFSDPHRIGLVPLQPTLFLTPDFNPRDLYYRGIIIIIIRLSSTRLKIADDGGGVVSIGLSILSFRLFI